MDDLARKSMEAVRDRLMSALRASDRRVAGLHGLSFHLAAVLKCLRDGAYPFDVLLAADTACDACQRAAVLPPIVAVVSAVEAAFCDELELDFPNAPEHERHKAAAFKALTMSDTELIVLINTDIEF